jgi:putative transposase
MLDRLAACTHRIRIFVQPPLHGFDNVIVLPPLDAALRSLRALSLQHAGVARVGPVAAQDQSIFLVRKVVGELLTGRADVNVLLRHVAEVLLAEAPFRKRTTTWSAFIRTHLALLAGTDFFSAEVLTLRGLVTYYVLFFIHLESRRVDTAGVTVHPEEPWMQQMARNVTMEGCGALRDCRYLLHDRDTKYTRSFRTIIASGRVEPLALPARSPNLNAYAERWIRSVKEECLCKVVLFGERSLRRALSEYVEHFHAERNHQGKDNILLFPRDADVRCAEPVQCRERLGGLLRYYHQEAA